MEKSKIRDLRRIKLEEVSKKEYIPFLEGRPKRSTVIQSDDLLNLKILLNTSRTFEEFISRV
jgi:hypothetical protein